MIRLLNKTFGDVPIGKIAQQQVEAWKARRKSEVSGARVNRELTCMKTIFSKAILWAKTDLNPVKGVKFFRKEMSRTRYLEKGERDALLTASAEWFRPILQTAFYTGMRRSEILALKWDDVDFKNRLLRVRMSKSGEGRYIPINDTLLTTLKAISRTRIASMYFATGKGSLYPFMAVFALPLLKPLKPQGSEIFISMTCAIRLRPIWLWAAKI